MPITGLTCYELNATFKCSCNTSIRHLNLWTGGDCHIYANHLEQVKKQLGIGLDPDGNPYPAREPYPYPKLVIKNKKASIFDYEYEDFELVGYRHHPGIAAPVAV